MPKELLTGSLEEQCDFLYEMAQEKMRVGNYTGAYHALKEVVKYAPDRSEAVALLALAKERKSEQTRLILLSLAGAILFVGFGSVARLSSDLWLLALGFVGLLVGYGVGNLLNSLRRPTQAGSQQ
ncbi:MAG: hypothetical protein KF753_15500 [Caldilineaceae bacterium]|nr:hypothetical protein [Caldilineaceae bacterium]